MSDISDRRTDLPPRAIGVPDTGQGLFQKFEVRRTDGSSEPGGKHEGCEYFVLDTDHDPFAPAALRAYADACEATHPLLARDLRERYPLGQREERTYVLVPILERFDQTKPIGWVKVLRAALPPTPDWCFNIGYKVLQGKPAASGRLQVTGYLLQSVSITSDAEYERVIDRENGRLLTEPTEHVVQALRERAIGIARDVADAFAKRRNDGSSTETLFVRLADELLREPELLKAIAAWHAAALQQVDGGQPQAAQPEAPAELRGLDTATRVRFYEHDFYVLSNFSAFALYWRGLRFDTSEAAYHWEKFTDSDGALVDVAAIRQAILTAASAHEAFKIAEKNKAHRRPDWDDVKVGIMLDILRAKAAQHEYVRRKLLATGDRALVENSWRDDFWGWGPNRDGQNMLGKLWMEVRAELRAA